MDLVSTIQFFGAPRLRAAVRRYRRESPGIRHAPSGVAGVAGPRIVLGRTISGEAVGAPAQVFAGHGLIVGATGAGKTWGATALAQKLLLAPPSSHRFTFGVIDAKGDLYARLKSVLSTNRSVCVDFGGGRPVPYALLRPRAGEAVERLVERRAEVFDDILGRDGQMSLRMGRMFRHLLFLAVEHDLSFPVLESLFSNGEACQRIGTASRSGRVKTYFEYDFERERRTTLPALQARLDFVLRDETLRLSFGANSFVDIRKAMDAGEPVLINTGGPGVSRAASRLIQSLVLSDLRQAVFARVNRGLPYLWFLDEAQTLFAKKADIENLTSLLTMARSFGAHFAMVTQSVVAACPDNDFLNQLETNLRWILMLRCGVADARLLEAALPISGRLARFQRERGRLSYLSEEQERRVRLREIANLPPRAAYLWLKGSNRPASRLSLPVVTLGASRGAETVEEWASSETVEQQLDEQERRLRALVTKDVSRTRAGSSLESVLARLDGHFSGREG